MINSFIGDRDGPWMFSNKTKDQLTEGVCVCPEGEGMDGPFVLDLARGLEVGGGVGRRAAARPQQQHPGGARELLLGVLRQAGSNTTPCVVPRLTWRITPESSPVAAMCSVLW